MRDSFVEKENFNFLLPFSADWKLFLIILWILTGVYVLASDNHTHLGNYSHKCYSIRESYVLSIVFSTYWKEACS